MCQQHKWLWQPLANTRSQPLPFAPSRTAKELPALLLLLLLLQAST
jgi:hypothetical protein